MCRRSDEVKQAVCSKFVEKIKQPSTWQGLALIGALFGVHVAPEYIDLITASVGLIATKNIIVDN